MVNYAYCGEIELMLVQFLSSLDGCIIKRERKNQDGTSSGEYELYSPRYIISGKNRVFYDIYNKAGNITLPVVVAELNGIKYDASRAFNKQLNQRIIMDKTLWSYHQPTPVTLSLSVNFYTKFMSDLYQLASNFIAFSQPYHFISWSLRDKNVPFIEELRSKVEWDGNFAIDYPKTPNEDEKWLIHGTAGFSIDGWIFNKEKSHSNLITKIDIYSHIVSQSNLGSISSVLENDNTDYYFKEGWPSVTAILTDSKRLYKTSNQSEIQEISGGLMTIEGRSFFNSQCTGLLIRPVNYDGQLDLTKLTVNTIRCGEVSGYSIEDSIVEITENKIKLDLKNLPSNITFDLVIYNNAGFTSVHDENGYYIKIQR